MFRADEELDGAINCLRASHLQTVKATDLWEPGTIGLTGPMRVEWLSLSPDDVVTFAEDFIARRSSDVSKLGRSGADERHLFIWSGVQSEGMAELRALGLDIESLPQRAPQLPPEITHLWIANEGGRPSRIVHWAPDQGWVEAGRVGDVPRGEESASD